MVVEYEIQNTILLGDINSDYVLNILDIIGLVNSILNINSIYIEIIDMNFDSKINIFDLIHITELI